MAKKTIVEVYDVESSNVSRFTYQPKEKVLFALLTSGREYRYEQVTKQELKEILEADSVGSAFNRIIVKANKTYTKM